MLCRVLSFLVFQSSRELLGFVTVLKITRKKEIVINFSQNKESLCKYQRQLYYTAIMANRAFLIFPSHLQIAVCGPDI